jgi:photosystem II stability/assembly factor-like uncharacterized protein
MKAILLITACCVFSCANAQVISMTRKGAPIGGNIIDIEVHSSGTVYAIVQNNGLFRSTDSGNTWAKVTVSANASMNNGLNDIEIDPAGAIYVVTNLSATFAAMFSSTDNGVTWTQRTGSNPFSDFNYSPRLIERSGTLSNSPIYIVTSYNSFLGRQSVFRSIDNGASWGTEVYSESSFSNEITGITSTASGAVVLLVNNKGVVRSATGTAGSFATSNSGIASLGSNFFHRGALAFAGSPARLFINAGSSGLAESTDVGQTWTVTPSLPGAFSTSGGNPIQMSGYGATLQVYNNAGTSPQLFTITVPASGAVTWSNATSGASRGLFTRFYARSATEFYLGETAGISRSNNGTTWTFSSTGIEGVQFLNSYANAPVLRLSATGMASGTVPQYTAGSDGATWTRTGSTGLIGQSPRGFVQLASGTWAMIADQTSVGVDVTNFYYSTDQGATWTPRALAVGENFLQAITTSGTTIYATSNNSRIYSSADEGVTWQQLIMSGLPVTFLFNNSGLSFFIMNNTLYLSGSDSGTKYYRVDLTTLVATQITQPPSAVTLVLGGLRGFGGNLYLTSTNSSTAQLSVSNNNGVSWSTVSVPGISSPQAFLTSSGYPAYATSAGVVTFTRDAGQSWLTANLGFGAEFFQIRSIETDPAGLLNVLVDSKGLYQSTTPVVLPAAPTNLQVLGSTFNQVRLEWDDNATNELYYRIDRSINTNTAYDSIGYFAATNFAAINTSYNADPQTTYFYRVIAVNAAGRSAYSNEISVTTPARCATTVPDNRSWSLTTLNDSGLGARTRANVTLALSRLDNFTFTLGSLGGNTPVWVSPNNALNTLGATLIENCGSVYVLNAGNYTMNGNGTWNAATGKITIKWKVNRGLTSSITPFAETTELLLNATDPAPLATTLQPFASVLDDTGIMVSWGVNPGFAQQVAIERATAAGGPYVEVGRVNHPETNFADRTPGLAFGNTYFYRLNFYNPAGNTVSTSTISVLFRKPYFAAIEAVPFYPVASKLYTSWVDLNNDGSDELFYTVSSNVNRAGFISNIGLPTVALSEFGDSNEKIYRNARFADMNNDGNIDMVCNNQDLRNGSGSFSALEVYHGNGTGGFTLAFRRAPVGQSFSDITLCDFNRDDRLDILVEQFNFNPVTLTSTSSLSILENLGNGAFSTGTHLYTNESGACADISLADYDNDGDTDILAAGIFGTANHRLLTNNGNGTFTQTTVSAFDINPSIAMVGTAWGDIDNDGDLDLLCTYGTAPTTKALFRNDGGGNFTNLTTSPVAEPFSASSNSGIFLDVENDGDLDVVVTQGIQSPTIPNAVLYLNNGSGIYTRRSGDGEFLNQSFPAKNQITAGDFNNDGYPDLAMGTSDRYRYVLQNNKFTTGNWLKVKLRGVASNRSGVGSRIQVVSATITQTREVYTQAGGNFNGQNSLTQHFGLGTIAGPLTVRVTWPNNKVQVVSNVAVNQLIEVVEDTEGPTLAFLPSPGSTDVFAGTSLEITTSEAANAVAGKSILVYLASDTSNPIFTLPVTSGTKTGNKFSFALPARLNRGGQYVVGVEEGAFADSFGNPSAVVPSASWQFTVGTGPIVSSQMPANNATNIAVNANIELNFDRAITAVAGKRIRIVDGPTTVINVEVTTGMVTNRRFTLDPASDFPFERVMQVILDEGAFIDASQNEFPGFASGQYSFTTVIAPDVTPPNISFDAATLASLEKGFAPVGISVTANDNRAVTKVTMFHRRSGAGVGTFNALSLTAPVAPQTNPWTGQVQNSFADDLGFEYYFEGEDAAGNKTRLPSQAAQFFNARIVFSGANRPVVSVPAGGSKASWRIIAIPYELSTSQISEVFSELGSSTKSTWRMLQYSANTNTAPVVETWVEFPAFTTIDRGLGYFINAVEGREIQLNNARSPDFSRAKLFELNLVKGWNLIGNPYSVQLLWDDIRTFNNITSSVGTLKLFANGSYSNGNELLPLRGGFVFANEAVSNVKFSFPGQTSGGRSRSPMFEGGDWLLPIGLVHEAVENNMGGIGMRQIASTSYDEWDDLMPPAFGNQLQMRFNHPEHFMGAFSRDVVHTTSEFVWSFTVNTNLTGTIAMQWPAWAESKDLYLFDEHTQQIINMREQNTYPFEAMASRPFKIYYGDNAREKIKPSRLVLSQVYPNPSAGLAQLHFTVPQELGGGHVSINVFDAMGRKVATLLAGTREAGFYQLTWDADQQNLGNGLYTIRLNARNGEKTETQFTKAVLIR